MIGTSCCNLKFLHLLISDDYAACAGYTDVAFAEILHFLFPFFKVHLSNGLYFIIMRNLSIMHSRCKKGDSGKAISGPQS